MTLLIKSRQRVNKKLVLGDRRDELEFVFKLTVMTPKPLDVYVPATFALLVC